MSERPDGDNHPTDLGELEKVIPSMNLTVPPSQGETKECIVSDEAMMGMYADILSTIQQDRTEIGELLNHFVDVAVNEGDNSTSTKEAIVQLARIKTDMPDKMTRVADLMTRIKLKDASTYKPYLNAKQENNFNLGDGDVKKEMIRLIAQAQKRAKKENKP